MATALAEATRPTRVLVFSVDDSWLCVDLDRVDTVYERRQVRVHTLKSRDGTAAQFLIHGDEPAMVVDLRVAFDLSEALGPTDRPAFVVLRAEPFPLALPIDACIGVRDLDLHAATPLPTSMVRDGGYSVGHLVELDGCIHTFLEPSRILGSSLRERLAVLLQDARAFCEREKRLEALAIALSTGAEPDALKTYARLARQNGHTRAASAARTVLKVWQDSAHPADAAALAGTLGSDTLLRDLLVLSAASQTGELHITELQGEPAELFLDAGRIIDGHIGSAYGHTAVKRILAAHEGTYRFIPTDAPPDSRRLDGATPWLLVTALTDVTPERRARQSR